MIELFNLLTSHEHTLTTFTTACGRDIGIIRWEDGHIPDDFRYWWLELPNINSDAAAHVIHRSVAKGAGFRYLDESLGYLV